MNGYSGEPRFYNGLELKNHLRDLINTASKIDIATAWVSGSAAVQLLASQDAKTAIRIVAGVGSYNTDPVALKTLGSRPNITLKIHGSAISAPLFHPKLYVFQHMHFCRILVGSMNLTRAGGEKNVESMFSFEDRQKRGNQEFERFWTSKEADWFDQFDLADYATKRRQRLAAIKGVGAGDVLDEDVAASAESKIEINALTDDWNTFRDGLNKASLGLDDYRRVLKVRGQLIERDWSQDFTKLELSIMFGLKPYQAFGWLPALNQNQAQFQGSRNLEKRLEIGRAFKSAAELTHFNAPIVEGVVRRLLGVKYCGPALATRLLVLANPEFFVVVSKKSFRGLQEGYGLVGSNLGLDAANYVRLLEKIYSTKWYQSPVPEDQSERELWQARAALVDAVLLQRNASDDD